MNSIIVCMLLTLICAGFCFFGANPNRQKHFAEDKDQNSNTDDKEYKTLFFVIYLEISKYFLEKHQSLNQFRRIIPNHILNFMLKN